MHSENEMNRHKRMLAIMIGKKAKDDLKTPEHDSPVDMAGEDDAKNEMQGGISEEGRDTPGVNCPHCGTHIDTNLPNKDGGDASMEGSPAEESEESPEEEAVEDGMHPKPDEEKHGRLFGNPKKGLSVMLAIGKGRK